MEGKREEWRRRGKGGEEGRVERERGEWRRGKGGGKKGRRRV